MKKIVFLWLLILCPISSYANQCRINPFIGGSEEIFISCKVEAEHGNAQAQYILALMYDAGEGTEQDKQKAAYWLTKSALKGESIAQYNLALIYDQGDGVEQNKLLANEYFKQSYEQGFEKACNKLKK